MNHKEHHAFALFFLIFLAVSSFPVLFTIVQHARSKALRGYDQWLKNRNIEVTQPAKTIKSPYGEELPETPPVVQPQRKGWANSRFTIIRQLKVFKKLLLPTRKYIEQLVINTFPFRDEFSTSNMAFKYHLGMKMPIEKDGTLLLPNKKMAVKLFFSPAFSQGEINKLLKYKELCDKNNINFFVIFRPFDQGFHHDYSEPYKGLILNYGQKLAQRAAQLEKLDIKTFELYKAMRSEIPEEKWQNYWYQTDHHWNVYGALLGGKLIADYMNKNCGTSYDLAYFDPEIYITKRWKNSFAGSWGKKLSLSYCNNKSEDFDILYPRFDTDFRIEIPAINFVKQGDFSVMTLPACINYDRYHAFLYNAFLNGNRPLIRIINNKIPEGKKIIVIKDSYNNPMVPFLALQTKEVIMLDPRQYPEKMIWQTIEQEKPDLLFIMFGAGL
ncbi:MAG: hypothetical protein E7038_01455 [Lentisphaerae bacterium]|nr:hypothetical protein [Lentisphaerota bacterium]